MKKQLFLSVLTLFVLTGCKFKTTETEAEQPIENDLTKAKLKGKVKSVKEATYKAVEKFGKVTKGDVFVRHTGIAPITKNIYDEKGNEIEQNDYNEKGELDGRIVYKYDENGNKIVVGNTYNKVGELFKKFISKYDEKGNKIEVNTYYNKAGELLRKSIFKYDYNGNKIKESFYRNGKLDSEFTFKYDYNGNKIESESSFFNENGELTEKHIAKYDHKGNEIELNWYYGNGKLYVKYIYEYDYQGNKIEENTYNGNGEITWSRVYKYDSKGNKIGESSYKKEGELWFITSKIVCEYDYRGNLIEWSDLYGKNGELLKYSYKYKYRKGNWIEKIVYENNPQSIIDTPKLITEREIEYYD